MYNMYIMTEDRVLMLVLTIGTVVEQTERGVCCQGTLSRRPGAVLDVKICNSVLLSSVLLLLRVCFCLHSLVSPSRVQS